MNVGYLCPADEANKTVGQEIKAGALFAKTYINSLTDPGAGLPLTAGSGLVGGAKLKLFLRGVASRCEIPSVFNDLVHNDHVVAIIGADASTYTLQGIAAADSLGIPFVNDNSSAASLTQADARSGPPECGQALPDTPSHLFFRVGASDETAAQQLVGAALTVGSNVSRAAFLGENNDIYGDDAAKVTERAVAAHLGIKRLRLYQYASLLNSQQTSTPGSCTPSQQGLVKQLSADVKDLKSYNPQALFVAAYQLDAVAIVQTMYQLDYHPPLLLAYGAGFVPDELRLAAQPGWCGLPAVSDPSFAHIYVRTPWAIGTADATARGIATRFQQQSGSELTPPAAAAFTTVITVGEAIDRTGFTDPAPGEFISQMQNLKVPGSETIMPWPNGIYFDDSGLTPGEAGQNAGAQFALEQVSGPVRPSPGN